MNDIRLKLAIGYANYLGDSPDTAKIPSAMSIVEIHWTVFDTYNIPARAFGGTPFGTWTPISCVHWWWHGVVLQVRAMIMRCPAMKKWLIVEAVLLTIVPAVLLIYALPFLFFGAVAMIFPVESDTRALPERVFRMLPYAGGIFGLWTVWRHVLNLSRGRRFRLDWSSATAVISGGVASWEFVLTTNVVSSLLVCLPTCVLVGHLIYLRRSFKE